MTEELRITGVKKKLKTDLNNIRKNLGVSLSDMLKPVIAEWADKQPQHLKREYEE